ncbi:MAG: hypothetical protein H7A40_06805 [Chlamydiales bacterium]|nr:hypothetical protein [Chlamydiales bacterium]
MKTHQTSPWHIRTANWYADTTKSLEDISKSGIYTIIWSGAKTAVWTSAITAALFKYSSLPPIFNRNFLSVNGLKHQWTIIGTGWRLKDAALAGAHLGVAAALDTLILHSLFTINNKFFNSEKKQPPVWLHLASRITAVGVTALAIGPNPIFLANAAYDISHLCCDYLVSPGNFSERRVVKLFSASYPILLDAPYYIFPAAFAAISYLGFESWIYSKLSQLKETDNGDLPDALKVDDAAYSNLFEIDEDKIPPHIKSPDFLNFPINIKALRYQSELLQYFLDLHQLKVEGKTGLFNRFANRWLKSKNESERFLAETLLNPHFSEEAYESIFKELNEYRAVIELFDFKEQCDKIISINRSIQALTSNEEMPRFDAKTSESKVTEFLSLLDYSDLNSLKTSSQNLSKDIKEFTANFNLNNLEQHQANIKHLTLLEIFQKRREETTLQCKQVWDKIIAIDNAINESSSIDVVGQFLVTTNMTAEEQKQQLETGKSLLPHPWVQAYLSSLDLSSIDRLKASSQEGSKWAKKFSERFNFENKEAAIPTIRDRIAYDKVANIQNGLQPAKSHEKTLVSICFSISGIFSAVFPKRIESFALRTIAMHLSPQILSFLYPTSPAPQRVLDCYNLKKNWTDVLSLNQKIQDGSVTDITDEKKSSNPFMNAFANAVDTEDLKRSSKELADAIDANLKASAPKTESDLAAYNALLNNPSQMLTYLV